MEELETWDAVIVGGGAAGLSAALMLGRARRRVVVIDAGSPRNRFADHMHGVLGNEGTVPGEFLRRGAAEAAQYGVVVRAGAVERVEDAAEALLLHLDDGTGIRARAAVIASGVSDELPDIPGLAPRWGVSVLHCPYCHGWEVRDRRLGVLMTSPMSLHQAELVRQWSDRITVFTAGAGGLSDEQAHRLRSRGIRLVDAAVVEVLGEGDQIASVRTATGEIVPLDALFTGGVLRPHDRFLDGLGLARVDSPVGDVLAVDAAGRTSHARIWAVGNVVNPVATVPMSVGAGAATGAALNGALVAEEFDVAVAEAGGRGRA